MRIAFYAPLKPPDHPVPSGDRRVARLLMAAMAKAGHRVELANRLRSRDPDGDPSHQARLAKVARARADRLLRRYTALPDEEIPQLWFTYHLYYKAPDHIGPRVAAGLGIPYVVAEASVANKRASGPWKDGHEATLAALDQAALVVTLNPADIEGLPDHKRIRLLRPFIDIAPFRGAAVARPRFRNALAARYGLDPEQPWLIAVGMMRSGAKLESYRVLALAMNRLAALGWQLLLIGDGPARPEVEEAFAVLNRGPRGRRVHYAGELAAEDVAGHLAAGDLFVWPAVNEAFGMAFLEAQATGLPVVAGRGGGVAAVVADGESGILTPTGNAAAFAEAVRELLQDRGRRQVMASLARARVGANHTIDAASAQLDGYLHEAIRLGPRPPAFLDIFGVTEDDPEIADPGSADLGMADLEAESDEPLPTEGP